MKVARLRHQSISCQLITRKRAFHFSWEGSLAPLRWQKKHWLWVAQTGGHMLRALGNTVEMPSRSQGVECWA